MNYYNDYLKYKHEYESMKKSEKREATVFFTIMAVVFSTVPLFLIIMLIKFLFE